MIAASSDGAALAGVLVVYLLFLIGLTVACGFWAKSIMVGKGRSGASGFCLGFFLGLVGVLIAALLSPTPEHEFRKQQQMMSMMGARQGYQQHGFGAQPYMAQATAPVHAGQWAPDPYRRHELRYYDGNNWTMSVSNAGVVTTDPLG